MIKNIAIKLQYDGTNYSGWQKQGNTGNTIQNKLEKILFKMLGEEIEVMAQDAQTQEFMLTDRLPISR